MKMFGRKLCSFLPFFSNLLFWPVFVCNLHHQASQMNLFIGEGKTMQCVSLELICIGLVLSDEDLHIQMWGT